MKMLAAKQPKKVKRAVKRLVRCTDTGILYASSIDAVDIMSLEGWVICPQSVLHT
jgi:hypothetical protein